MPDKVPSIRQCHAAAAWLLHAQPAVHPVPSTLGIPEVDGVACKPGDHGNRKQQERVQLAGRPATARCYKRGVPTQSFDLKCMPPCSPNTVYSERRCEPTMAQKSWPVVTPQQAWPPRRCTEGARMQQEIRRARVNIRVPCTAQCNSLQCVVHPHCKSPCKSWARDHLSHAIAP